jgi:hypothetical protein
MYLLDRGLHSAILAGGRNGLWSFGLDTQDGK